MGRGLRVVKLLHDLLHKGHGVSLRNGLDDVVLVGLGHSEVVGHPRVLVATGALKGDLDTLAQSGLVARAGKDSGDGSDTPQNRRARFALRMLLAET